MVSNHLVFSDVWMANLCGLVVLQAEIDTCMKLLGVKEISELGPRFVSIISASLSRLEAAVSAY